MSTSQILEKSENQILLAARMVREHYFPRRTNDLPDWVLIIAIRELLECEPNVSPNELFELLITQSRVKSLGHLSRFTAALIASDAKSANARASKSEEINVFSGDRKYSISKIAAMVTFITSRGHTVTRSKLNKLLFYCDFVNYFLYDRSISGAKYVRQRYGPEMYQYESILKTLQYMGIVKIKYSTNGEEEFIAGADSAFDELSILQLATMTWVFSNFGSMTPSAIRQHTQSESAYRFTRQDDFIPYEYARILQKLPE